MKIKLYRKLVSSICKTLKISRKQLFSRDFDECILKSYKFDLSTKKHHEDYSTLHIFTRKHPLSSIYRSVDWKTSLLFDYWKHSHHKSFIQVKLDLGYKLEDILREILHMKKM